MSDEWQDRLIYSEVQPVTDLLPLFHPDNPKIHPVGQTEALKGAIATLGWMARPKINVRSSEEWGEAQDVPVVIDGHDRIKAANESEQSELMCDFYDLSPNEERLFLLTYDPIGMMAEHDRTQVEALLHQVNTDDERLQQMLADFAQEQNLDWGQLAQPEGEADAEPQISRADELQKEWGVETGQMWRLPSRTPGQEHRIICGDCTDADIVERVMMGEKARYGIHDPPYGIDVVAASAIGGGKPFGDNVATIGGSNVVSANVYAPIHGDDKDYNPRYILSIAEDNILWGANYYADKLEPVKGWIVWDKKGREWKDNFSDCELAWTSLPITTRIIRHTWMGMVQEGERELRLHPTQKPQELYKKIIQELFTEVDGVIVDFYAGSCPTIIAAENLSRQCRAIEISPAYVAVCLQRYLDAFGIKAELVEG